MRDVVLDDSVSRLPGEPHAVRVDGRGRETRGRGWRVRRTSGCGRGSRCGCLTRARGDRSLAVGAPRSAVSQAVPVSFDAEYVGPSARESRLIVRVLLLSRTSYFSPTAPRDVFHVRDVVLSDTVSRLPGEPHASRAGRRSRETRGRGWGGQSCRSLRLRGRGHRYEN